MKGWKEEKEKSGSGGPMFPRLHVNDTEKGGPRAPPRNKMALYEQLSFPSQKFGPTTTMPLPARQNPHSQGNQHDRNPFSPFQASPSTSRYSTEKVNSCSSDVGNMETTRTVVERRFTRNVDFKSAKAAKSVAECSSLALRNSSTVKNSCRKRVDDDEEDFRVPTFINSGKSSYLNKDTTGTEKKKLSPFHSKSLQAGISGTSNSYKRPLERGNTSNVKSINPERSRNEQNLDDAVATNEHRENSLSGSEACKKLALPSKFSKSSSNREDNTARNVAVQTRQESCGHPFTSDRDMRNTDTLTMRHDSHVEASCGNIHSDPKVTDKCNRDNDSMEDGQQKLQDADKSDSETSRTDSMSGFEISPDDVVGVIGQKQFWKARRAIVNQQRVFAVQVFELHRLLQVQKLLASSPHLLLEENPYTVPQKEPIKNLMIEAEPKSHSPTVKQMLDTQKPNQNTECRKENTAAHSRNEVDTQPPRHNGHFSGSPTPLPSAPEHGSNPWCFQPPTNQWLVPVMSPSEGLIYKPFSGPCPPATGFMTPVYGNYNPVASNYLPTPCVMNPIVCSPSVERARPNGHTEQNSRSSCNMSFPKSDVVTARTRKVRATKDSELQGSTASSPSGRTQGGRDVLPLFPMAPTAEDSLQPSEEECQTRAIRVVPHNARSATESAARIFRSIQEERQQN